MDKWAEYNNLVNHYENTSWEHEAPSTFRQKKLFEISILALLKQKNIFFLEIECESGRVTHKFALLQNRLVLSRLKINGKESFPSQVKVSVLPPVACKTWKGKDCLTPPPSTTYNPSISILYSHLEQKNRQAYTEEVKGNRQKRTTVLFLHFHSFFSLFAILL